MRGDSLKESIHLQVAGKPSKPSWDWTRETVQFA
jgi:hypothetical protein